MQNVFKKGDIIRGLNNSYGITNENMIRAKVISIDEKYDTMEVQILKHKTRPEEVGETYEVLNDDKRFVKVHDTFNKSLITDGCKITLDNGEQLIYLKNKDIFANTKRAITNSIYDIDDINQDGTTDGDNYIVKVEKPCYDTIYEKTEEEPKEMTLKEVCDALGYEVKIKKD